MTYLKMATPPSGSGIGKLLPWNDPYHLAVWSLVMYEQCVNGQLQTQENLALNVLEFTWSTGSNAWIGPN